jgi:hypothetical protein
VAELIAVAIKPPCRPLHRRARALFIDAVSDKQPTVRLSDFHTVDFSFEIAINLSYAIDPNRIF